MQYENCSQWFKDTNLKANHNTNLPNVLHVRIVPNGSKILIWKQITTDETGKTALSDCSQWFKDTNLKANHNVIISCIATFCIVPNGSKILIWKQITTHWCYYCSYSNCSQWFKDTNLKANHNNTNLHKQSGTIVPNGSKILIWKQITTQKQEQLIQHKLFPMVQRY